MSGGVIGWLAAAAEPEYFYAKDGCTWHGPAAHIEYTRVDGEGPRLPCCPCCGRELVGVDLEEEFWAMVKSQERNCPGYEDLIRWAELRCFDSFETMENTYRQAMEGLL